MTARHHHTASMSDAAGYLDNARHGSPASRKADKTACWRAIDAAARHRLDNPTAFRLPG